MIHDPATHDYSQHGTVLECWTPGCSSARYGTAQAPQPTRAHTCKIRRRLEKGWSTPTSQDDCPACQVDRREGWAQLLASFRDGLLGDAAHG